MSYPLPPVIKGRAIVLPIRTGRCLWCGKDLSFDGRRISFCKEKHADKYYSHFTFAESSYKILERDQYKCVKCGFDEREFNKILEKKFPGMWDWRNNSTWQKRVKYIESKGFSNNQAYLEVDHIKSIRMGGNPFDPKNQQTLCYRCHKEKTKDDVRKISHVNAICREIKKKKELEEQQKKMANYWRKYQ